MKTGFLIIALSLLLLSAAAVHAHNLCTTNAVVQFVQNQTGAHCSSNGTLAWKCPVPGGPAGQAFLIWGQGPSSPSSNHGVYLLQLNWGSASGNFIQNIEQITCNCPGDPDVCRVSHVY